MRWRGLALVSLGVNVALAAGWWGFAHRGQVGNPVDAAIAQASAANAHTNLVVRRQFFKWQEVESPDYPTYIANLREIGCPEQTIRDIIIADVNALYARKRATELVTPEQQWWRSEPDTNVLVAASEKARGLEEERRALLARLLGTNWESGDMVSLPRPTRPGIVLDGPVLGVLPADVKQQVQEISNRSQERLQAYLEAQIRDGKNTDPQEIARLRQQTRDELGRVLAPAQLEEFLLRYSQDANELRSEFGQLKFFHATPEEFRAVFRATDALDQQISALTGNDPSTIDTRKALEEQRENAIKIALGPKRYEQYLMLQDPMYRDAMAQAVEAGTPEAANMIYDISLAAASQQASINTDTNLTAIQKSLALKQLELEQMTANTLATGQEPPPGPPPLPPTVPRRTYVIHPGDTVAVVSLIYGVPVSAIRQANPGLNFNRLKPGDAIIIPQGQTPLAAP